MAVVLEDLRQKYAGSVDPWNFRTSPYEQQKFDATVSALSRDHYGTILEVGCGNGELAKRLAQMCDRYVGLDAVDVAIAEAKRELPIGEFHNLFFPCQLPEGEIDLIVLSEVLYFLDERGIVDLAGQISARWPQTEIMVVNYLGPSGNDLQGGAAALIFKAALGDTFQCRTITRLKLCRIDCFHAEMQGRH